MPLTELVNEVTELSQISGSIDAFVNANGAGNRSVVSATSPNGELLNRREDVFMSGAMATSASISARVLMGQIPNITLSTDILPSHHQTGSPDFDNTLPINRNIYDVGNTPVNPTLPPGNTADVPVPGHDHNISIAPIPTLIPSLNSTKDGDNNNHLRGKRDIEILSRGHNTRALDLYSGSRLRGDFHGRDTCSSKVVDDLSGSLDLTVGLYNTDSDTLITQIEEGSEISASIIAGKKITIVAFINEDNPRLNQVESIALNLNQGQLTQIESLEPYTLFGDRNGDFRGSDMSFLTHGENSITFDLYSKNGANGNLLGTVTRSFTIV